jgi:hypothetical protein
MKKNKNPKIDKEKLIQAKMKELKAKENKFDEDENSSIIESSIDSENKINAYANNLMNNQEYSISDVDVDDIDGK